MPNNNLEDIFNTQIQFLDELTKGQLTTVKALQRISSEPALRQMSNIAIGYICILNALNDNKPDEALVFFEFIRIRTIMSQQSNLDISLYLACRFLSNLSFNRYPQLHKKASEILLDFFNQYRCFYNKPQYQKVLTNYMHTLKGFEKVDMSTLSRLHSYVQLGKKYGVDYEVIKATYESLIKEDETTCNNDFSFFSTPSHVSYIVQNKLDVCPSTSSGQADTWHDNGMRITARKSAV